MSDKILFVDDDPNILQSIQRSLGRQYDIVVAYSGQEGLKAIQERGPFTIVVSDILMPGMDGVEFLSRVRELCPDSVRMALSGYADLETTIDVVNRGDIFRFLTKPCARDQLILAIEAGLHQHKLHQAQQELAALSRIHKGLEAALGAFVSLAEARDPYTAGHMRIVAELAHKVAQEMKLPEESLQGLRLAAMVHDIGKISVPAEILNKPGRLNKAEFELIKAHVLVGSEVMSSIDFPWPISRIILEHHERIDGSGYPNGTGADELLVESKVLAVADMTDAIQAHRPYRPGLGIAAASEILREERGISLDSDAVDACLRVLESGFYDELVQLDSLNASGITLTRTP